MYEYNYNRFGLNIKVAVQGRKEFRSEKVKEPLEKRWFFVCLKKKKWQWGEKNINSFETIRWTHPSKIRKPKKEFFMSDVVVSMHVGEVSIITNKVIYERWRWTITESNWIIIGVVNLIFISWIKLKIILLLILESHYHKIW